MASSNEISVDTTLPASWYREKSMYELERRAIWSQKWILASHASRFKETGDYVKYDVAGFSYFLIRNKDDTIKGFLNVCRHRAYPLLTEASGKARILACKYHGWSYGLSGKVAKAPRFDTVPEFDVSQFSLFEIHTHLDAPGFIWVNLDAAETPTTSWEDQFGGIDQQPRLGRFKMEEYSYESSWAIEGTFNWKTLVDNYNECYHCATAHPGIAPFLTKSTKFDSGRKKGYIEHYAEANFGEMVTSPTFTFPNSTMTMTDKFWYLMRINPISETSTVLEYEFYRHKDVTDADYEENVQYFKDIETEDKFLSQNAQNGLNSETYVAGPLHPYMEAAVIYFQKLVRAAVLQQRDKEKKAGQQIAPARRTIPSTSLSKDEVFCQELCSADKASSLQTVW